MKHPENAEIIQIYGVTQATIRTKRLSASGEIKTVIFTFLF